MYATNAAPDTYTPTVPNSSNAPTAFGDHLLLAPDRTHTPPRPVGRPVPGTQLRVRFVKCPVFDLAVEVRCDGRATTYSLPALEREADNFPGGYSALLLATLRGDL